MFYLIAFAVFPVLLLLTAPLGLAIFGGARPDKAAADIRAALAPVVGLAAQITVLSLGLRLGLKGASLVPLAAVVAAAAVVRLAGRRDLWPDLRLAGALTLAGLVAYLIFISPLLSGGGFAVLGHNVNNDPVFHSIIPEYLGERGYNFPGAAPGGFTQAAFDKLVNQGYPDGWHIILLLISKILSVRAFALFNFTEAFFMALLAPVAYLWLRRLNVARGWALGGGLAAAVGYLQLSYVFQGFAPQIAVTPFIYACLLLFYLVLVEGRWRYVLPGALLLQASLAVYSFTILLWLGAFVIAALVYRFWVIRSVVGLKVEAAAAGLTVVAALLINPLTLLGLRASFLAVTGFSAADGMGNLVSRHVPVLPVFGIWPVGDHRLVPSGWLHPGAYLAAAVLLAVMAVGAWAKPNRALTAVLAAAVIAPALLLKAAAGPYYFAKTLQLAAPAAVILLFRGLYAQWAAGRRPAVLGLTGLYVFGALLSALPAVQIISVTPISRFAELLEINEKFRPGRGLTLFVETGEDWGKYLLSRHQVVSPLARSYQGATPGLRSPYTTTRVQDLDNLGGVLARRFDLIVIDRAQDISLAPVPFQTVFSGRFYNVYKKAAGSVRAVKHIAVDDPVGVGGSSYRQIRPGKSLQLQLGKKFKSVLVSAYLFPHVVIEPTEWRPASSNWQFGELNGETVLNLANQPGKARSNVELFEVGPYDVFLTGDLNSRLTISINGRSLAPDPKQSSLNGGPGNSRWVRFPVEMTDRRGRVDLAAGRGGSGLYVGRLLLASRGSQPGDRAAFSVGGEPVKLKVGRFPAVYAIPVSGDAKAVLRVKNISMYPLRIDWIEPLSRPYDRATLLRYNNRNKVAFQSVERLVSR